MSVKNNEYGIAPVQEKMLGILKHFISVCQKYNLKYCAGGGTCIGALRHQGFIPWDEDLDVLMPRPDYEKLWKLYDNENEPKFKLCRTTPEKNYHHRVMQMVDIDTTFINRRSQNEDIEHGVYIDIIPLDACPSSLTKRISQIFNSMVFSVYNMQSLPEYYGGRMMRATVKLLLYMVKDSTKRAKIWQNAEKRMLNCDWGEAERLVMITANFKALMHPCPKSWLECNGRMEEFEDIRIIVPDKAEEYLTLFFGDFMELPPKKDRNTRHNTVLIDLDNSYTKYKGMYYCVNKTG